MPDQSSSRNPVLKSIIGNKPKIVLLNKSDMEIRPHGGVGGLF